MPFGQLEGIMLLKIWPGERVPGNPWAPFLHVVQSCVWWDAAPSRACQEGAGAEHAATSLQFSPSKTSCREDICNS